MRRLGTILENRRGERSRVQFAKELELSYTFVRAMEHGLRFPSDKVLVEIAQKLGLDQDELFLAAYCDRSSQLARVLGSRGVEIPVDGNGVVEPSTGSAGKQIEMRSAQTISVPAERIIRAHGPF
jgi:transcriptional regulator with XRE-family HTH domain